MAVTAPAPFSGLKLSLRGSACHVLRILGLAGNMICRTEAGPEHVYMLVVAASVWSSQSCVIYSRTD